MVSEQLHLPTAVLFVSDAKMLQRCETSIRELRTVGRYEGIVEFVTSDKNMSTVGNEHTVVSSVSSYIADFRNHIGKDYKPTGPCPLIPFKRRKGLNAYQYKVFVSMHPVWRQKYSSLLYMDCGMHAHSSFSTDLFDVAKEGRFHAHRDDFPHDPPIWHMHREWWPECDRDLYGKFARKYNRSFHLPYFRSSFYLYATRILSFDVLMRILWLYDMYGSIADGDQPILNLYWTFERRLWTQLPVSGPHCPYHHIFVPRGDC